MLKGLKSLKFREVPTQILVTALIGLISLLFFLSIGYTEVFDGLGFFRQRNFAILFSVGAIFLSFFYFYKSDNHKLTQKVWLWIQSSLSLFIPYAYYLRIHKIDVSILSFDINTAILFVPFLILIIYSHLYFFGYVTNNFLIKFFNVWLFSAFTFSYLNLLEVENISNREFVSNVIEVIISLPDFFWLSFTAIGIAIFSVYNYRSKILKENLYWLGLHTLIYFTLLWLISSYESLTYWEQSLIFLIIWDYIGKPLQDIAKNLQRDNYEYRILATTMYHFVLLIIVFFISL